MTGGGAEPGRYVLTVGESMGLLRQRDPGRLATQRTLGFGFGGAESNVAIGLARLGAPVVWCGRLGDDGVGELIARELRAEGVTPRVTTDPDAPTGLMLKERPTSGTSRVVYYRRHGAGSRLAPSDVPAGLVERAALVHLTGITPALSDSAAQTVDAVIDRAREAGVTVALDLNYRSALWPREEAARHLTRLLGRVDIVFAGDDEAAIVLGDAPPEELARGLRALGPAEAIIKLGARGCHANDGEHALSVAAVPIAAVDTVGAGDAFVAGYLADWLAGAPLSERLATAVTAGAFACLTEGDWEGLPRRRDFALLHAADPVQR
ncbi:sugar kinase [Leucobacter chromiireducens]|uniref:sugar kinase n=1 Tax=Leucobacter chromiireducens TaxID=283877 RepID=UPI000F63FCDD|nr:sugar kinase [Leucobacter chromiireducens]